MSARVAFRTLGCRLNQYETEAVAAEFTAAGYEVVPFEEPADIYVINSCTITAGADRKSRNLVYRALRALGAGTDRTGADGGGTSGLAGARGPVVLTGCFSERHGSEFADDPRVLIVGNEAKNTVFDSVAAWRRPASARADGLRPQRQPHAPGRTPDRFGFRAGRGVFRTRAAVKIQDGCDRFCTYCIVPRVRGRAVSRAPASVLEEVRRVVDGGAREIVLTGVNLGGFSYGETDFPALLEQILDRLPEDGRVRLRISSLEPEGLDARFTRLFADRRLAPHVHLCLQSGSDRVLERMNRRYRVDDVRRIAAGLRGADPTLNLTTDIIVGFPGETDGDAAASHAVAAELGFSHIHVFPFSPREGTAAARMPDQVPAAVKRERARALRELATRLKRRFYARLVGGAEEVLVETAGAAGARGYGRSYAPVRIDGAGLSCNEIYPVSLTGLVEEAQGPILTGTIRRPG